MFCGISGDINKNKQLIDIFIYSVLFSSTLLGIALLKKFKIIKWVSKSCWNIGISKVTLYIEKDFLVFRYQNGASVSSRNVIFSFKLLVK